MATIPPTLADRLREIADLLRREYKAERIILFGSHAKGTADEESDVDLLIVAPTKQPFHERVADAVMLTYDLAGDLALEPIVVTQEELQERLDEGDPFMWEIVEEGVEL